MKLYAYVLHNVGPKMFWSFDKDNLHHAHTFQVEADSIEVAANLIWNLTNVGSTDDLRVNFPHLAEYAPQVSDYRMRENRSLSVGDAIVFLERERLAGILSVASVGFDEVTNFDMSVLTNVSNDGFLSDARKAHREFSRRPEWSPNA